MSHDHLSELREKLLQDDVQQDVGHLGRQQGTLNTAHLSFLSSSPTLSATFSLCPRPLTPFLAPASPVC